MDKDTLGIILTAGIVVFFLGLGAGCVIYRLRNKVRQLTEQLTNQITLKDFRLASAFDLSSAGTGFKGVIQVYLIPHFVSMDTLEEFITQKDKEACDLTLSEINIIFGDPHNAGDLPEGIVMMNSTKGRAIVRKSLVTDTHIHWKVLTDSTIIKNEKVLEVATHVAFFYRRLG
ncbi:MAG TPA: hypothetical protein VGE63_02070 [Candidatus Paceibacterota bacterium]